ncbi:MAG: J domain-containing protein [Myxococcota bacterium]|nr:J domain-containing protein [Myxococcota bacterium]
MRPPRRTGRGDPAALPIDPADAFLLSRIDGATSVDELALISGKSAPEVRGSLYKLASLDLIEFAGRGAEARPSGSPGGAGEPASGMSPADRRGAAGGGARRRLSQEQMKRVDAYLVRIEGGDFYGILGVKPSVQKDGIRRAFFALSKEFHPDAYYGFALGEYEAKLERIFRSLSQAYEVLSRPARRKAYDEYRRGQTVLGGFAAVEDEVRADRQEEPRRGTPPPLAVSGPSSPADEPDGAAVSAPDTQPPGAAKSPAPRAGPSPSDGWRRQRTARQIAAVLGMAGRKRASTRGVEYLAQAERAAQAGEWGRVMGLVEAAEKFGVAPGLDEVLRDLSARARVEMAGVYFRQARFAEGIGNLADATRNVEMACKHGPDVAAHWTLCASLLLRQNRDLHGARDAAQRAVALQPEESSYRLLLARVYLAAGLWLNARRAAEEAANLPGGADEARRLLEAARRGEAGKG